MWYNSRTIGLWGLYSESDKEINNMITKFFRDGGDEARKEWKKTTKNEVEVKDMRLTEEELHTVWDFATNTPNTPQLEINPCWLISMVEEIRVHRSVKQKSVGMRLMELDQKTRCDLVYIVGCAMNTTDPKVFSDCLETIAEMIFPEIKFPKKEVEIFVDIRKWLFRRSKLKFLVWLIC